VTEIPFDEDAPVDVVDESPDFPDTPGEDADVVDVPEDTDD
jgi:hypothetical protein